eukprot:3996116-Prymnesium_polylepis.1
MRNARGLLGDLASARRERRGLAVSRGRVEPETSDLLVPGRLQLGRPFHVDPVAAIVHEAGGLAVLPPPAQPVGKVVDNAVALVVRVAAALTLLRVGHSGTILVDVLAATAIPAVLARGIRILVLRLGRGDELEARAS